MEAFSERIYLRPPVSTTIKYLRRPYSRVFISKNFGCPLTLIFNFHFFGSEYLFSKPNIFSGHSNPKTHPTIKTQQNLINFKTFRIFYILEIKLVVRGDGGRGQVNADFKLTCPIWKISYSWNLVEIYQKMYNLLPSFFKLMGG